MRYHPARTSPSSRLRMVFDDAVIMLNLASGATYGDVAALWDDKANGCDRATIAIAVTMDPGMPLPSSWTRHMLSPAETTFPVLLILIIQPGK